MQPNVTRLSNSLMTARLLRWGLLSFFAVALVLGCGSSSEEVEAHLEGQITVRSSVDASGDYSGFRVLVIDANRRAIDTLGHVVTDPSGRFRTTVTAPDRGIYTLTVWGRRGHRRLASTDYVVANGDSTTLAATFPLQNRPLRVRSPENAALAGYRNTLAQHRRSLVDGLQSDAGESNAMAHRIRQTTSVLWGLRESFPGTYASQLAATESLSLLTGWNDSLVVARAQSIEPSNPRFVEAAQVARRAAAQLEGQQSALALLDAFEERAETDAQRAGVQAARVRAFVDSLQSEAALSAAQDLKAAYPNTKWAEWADRATYEVKNLLPGNEAPNVRARTLSGDSLSLDELQGRPVMLEYFAPGNQLYERQLSTRNALYEATRPDSVAFVSVSIEPDTLLYQAFANDRSVPGHRVIAAGGREDPLVKTYNVADVPTRFLIGEDGRIVGRYEGTAFLALQEDLVQMLDTESPSSRK